MRNVKKLTTKQTITKYYKSNKSIDTSNLVTKLKPFEKLFKSKTTSGQQNSGNQSTIEE